MIEQRNHNNETHRILIYTDLAQGTEVTQIYTISSKDTVKDVIKQILARNHLSLKDPNLFYLTYRRQTNNENITTTTTNKNNKHIKSKQQGLHGDLYESMEVNALTSGIWSLNQNSKEIDVTLYSDAILSRTLDLTKDNRLTLHMQTGGVLKIYDSCFSNPASIRQFHIAKTTCSEELIDLILTVTCSSDPVTDYCLVEEGINEEGRILRPKDYPLLIVQNSQSLGVLVLRKKQDALLMCKRRSAWMNKTKPYFRRSLRDKGTRTPSPVKQTLTQRLNPFPCIFKGLSKSRILENISCETLPSLDKVEFIESESNTNQANGNECIDDKRPRPISTKPLPLKYMNDLDSEDKFEIFSPSHNNNNNGFDKLGYNSQTLPFYNRLNAIRSTSNNDHVASEWSLAPSETHHIMKATSTTPPLPPKSTNSRGRYINGIQHRQYNSYHPSFYEKQSNEQHRQCSSVTEGNKICKPERSASPILAFDANRMCESRQSAVRFQENTNTSGIWTKENECSLEDTTRTAQINGFKPKVFIDRAQSSDSIQTFTPADWDDKTTSHEKVTDSANVGTTYDNGCSNTVTEYDVPADNYVDWKHSIPPPILYDSYSKQKCSDKPNNDYCINRRPSYDINSTQLCEKKPQIQQKKHQRGDRSEENKHGSDIQAHIDFCSKTNGDYDQSLNDFHPTKSDLDRIKLQNSYTQMNSPTKLILNTYNTNNSLELQGMKEIKSFETITTSQSCEDFSLYRHQFMSNSQNNFQNESYSSTSHLSVPTPFHDSDVSVSMVSRENMLTLATELPIQPNEFKQYETHLDFLPNTSVHNNHSNDSGNNNNNLSTLFQQRPSSQVHKLFTYNFEAINNHINSQSSLELTSIENGREATLNNSSHLKHEKKSSYSKKHDRTGILVHGCKKTNASSSDIESVESYPSLFDVLHHCDIYRVILDPNLPSLSDQLGLRLCLTKFPLDDVQRADTLQKLQNNEIFDIKSSDGSVETMNTMNSPKGPKPYIGPRNNGTFKPIEMKRSDMAFDVVTIESIEPDSPASFEGSLAPGHIILEVDGKDLLHPKCLKDGYGNKLNILTIAQNQLRAARQAALNGEIPPIRITAAQYHNNFGLANIVNNLERLSVRPKNGLNRNMHTTTNHNTFDKLYKTNGIINENDQQYTDFDPINENSQSFKTSDPSEINSKYTISEITNSGEDLLELLKSKLIWFSRNQQIQSYQSSFDPRCLEN
uniref:Ras-associating domain-containing protein n=1 Tax=Schistosoma mansoni TaxID=6183 RepID=A0A3Q0KV17_SCHMA